MRTNKVLITVNNNEITITHPARNVEIYKGTYACLGDMYYMILGYSKGVNSKSPWEVITQGDNKKQVESIDDYFKGVRTYNGY